MISSQINKLLPKIPSMVSLLSPAPQMVWLKFPHSEDHSVNVLKEMPNALPCLKNSTTQPLLIKQTRLLRLMILHFTSKLNQLPQKKLPMPLILSHQLKNKLPLLELVSSMLMPQLFIHLLKFLHSEDHSVNALKEMPNALLCPRNSITKLP
jgi:hypothetical protein